MNLLEDRHTSREGGANKSRMMLEHSDSGLGNRGWEDNETSKSKWREGMTEELRVTSQKVIKKLCKSLMEKCSITKEKAQSMALRLEESVVKGLTADQSLNLESYKTKIVDLFNNLVVDSGDKDSFSAVARRGRGCLTAKSETS